MSEDVPGARVEIDLACDLHGFFEDLLDDALRSHGYSATEASERYVVGILADFAKPAAREVEALERPLTLLLDEALHSAGSERFERLRSLGDGVLYTSGFFAEHLKERGVELRYVRELGARAYDGAASMLRGHGESGAPDLFRELSDNFTMFADMVGCVADALQANSAHVSDREMVRLYERWLRTGSAPLAAVLLGRGVSPQRGQGGIH